MPAVVLVMGKKEGCNKMNKKVHFVTAPFLFGSDRSCPKEGLKPIRCIIIVIGGDVIFRLVEIGETDAHQGELGVEDEVIGPAALLAGGKISHELWVGGEVGVGEGHVEGNVGHGGDVGGGIVVEVQVDRFAVVGKVEEGLEVGAGSECLIQFFHHVVVEEDGIVILVAIGIVAVDLLVAFGMVIGVGHVASHIMKDDEGLLAALHACELFGEGIVVDVKVGGGAEMAVLPVLLVGFGGNDGGRGIPDAEADLVADPYGVESGGFGGFDEGGGVCEGHVVVLVLCGQSIGECRDGLHVAAVSVIKEKEVRVVSARRKVGRGRTRVAIDIHVLTVLGFTDGKDIEAGSGSCLKIHEAMGALFGLLCKVCISFPVVLYTDPGGGDRIMRGKDETGGDDSKKGETSEARRAGKGRPMAAFL